jgi:hypothetical protein
MKTKNIVSSILAIALLSTLSLSYASADSDWENKEERMKMKESHKAKIGEMKKEHRSKMDGDNKKMIEEREAKMMETMKLYIEALPKETQEKLSELIAKRKAVLEVKRESREKMKEEMEDISDEEKKESRENMKEKSEARKKEIKEHFLKVKEIVWEETTEGKAFISKYDEIHKGRESWMREGKKEKKWEYKKERKEMKSEYKNRKFELRMKYKKAFAEKLSSRIDKISDKKLNIIIGRIEAALSKIEANTKISEDKKEKSVAQLVALRDIIVDKIDNTSEDIDFDEILN